LNGVYFAMQFLEQNNKRVAGDDPAKLGEPILATGKHVVVIGGGDTGADCVGTSNRHGAASVTQIEVMGKPPLTRAASTPWPNWPMMLRTSTSHEEGCEREWAISTKAFMGDENGNLTGLKIAEIEWKDGKMVEIDGTERILPCDMTFIAAGFLHPQHEGMLAQMGIKLDGRGNVADNNYQTNIPKVFAAGDMRRGQSLVVWAISEGREAARAVDEYLMGRSNLEMKDNSLTKMILEEVVFE
jgi:glutamate synthase (NADPH/NADH) small chain